MSSMVTLRNNVTTTGRSDGPVMLFVHGFGCDQNMWRMVVPAFEADHRIVLFDHVGAGRSSLAAYDRDKYSTLDGYAADLLEICRKLDLHDVTLVGHSVSASIAVLAAITEPERFECLVLVAPSPRFIDDDATGYVGGFSAADITGLLESLDSNYFGWATAMAPMVMANLESPELGAELTASFCRTDPDIASQFARVTFLSDARALLSQVRTPSLILQCSDDLLAPEKWGATSTSRSRAAPWCSLPRPDTARS